MSNRQTLPKSCMSVERASIHSRLDIFHWNKSFSKQSMLYTNKTSAFQGASHGIIVNNTLHNSRSLPPLAAAGDVTTRYSIVSSFRSNAQCSLFQSARTCFITEQSTTLPSRI